MWKRASRSLGKVVRRREEEERETRKGRRGEEEAKREIAIARRADIRRESWTTKYLFRQTVARHWGAGAPGHGQLALARTRTSCIRSNKNQRVGRYFLGPNMVVDQTVVSRASDGHAICKPGNEVSCVGSLVGCPRVLAPQCIFRLISLLPKVDARTHSRVCDWPGS